MFKDDPHPGCKSGMTRLLWKGCSIFVHEAHASLFSPFFQLLKFLLGRYDVVLVFAGFIVQQAILCKESCC